MSTPSEGFLKKHLKDFLEAFRKAFAAILKVFKGFQPVFKRLSNDLLTFLLKAVQGNLKDVKRLLKRVLTCFQTLCKCLSRVQGCFKCMLKAFRLPFQVPFTMAFNIQRHFNDLLNIF